MGLFEKQKTQWTLFRQLLNKIQTDPCDQNS